MNLRVAVAMCVLAPSSVGSAAPKARSKAPAPVAPRVVALPTKSSDVNELLGVRTWEFDVRLAALPTKTFLLMHVHRKGHAAREMLRLPLEVLSGARRVRVFVGLFPPGGGLTESKQVKWMVRVHDYNRRDLPTWGMSHIIDNPFDGMLYSTPDKAFPQKDGGFLLVGVGKDAKTGFQEIISGNVRASAFDTALTLRIK